MNGDRDMVATWGKHQHNHLTDSSLFRVWSQKTRKPVTFERKIQTPKCSREKRLFSLTVASSSRNPSRALRRQRAGWDPGERNPEKTSLSPGTAASMEPVGCEEGKLQDPCEVTWGTNTKTADTANCCWDGRSVCAQDQQYLLGEQREPGAARWRETAFQKSLERLQGLKAPWDRCRILLHVLPEQVVNVLLLKVTREEPAGGSTLAHALFWHSACDSP